VKYDLDHLLATATLICEEAFKKKHEIKASLNCTEAAYYETVSGATGHYIIIEEASPDAIELGSFVRKRLEEEGYSDIEVRLTW
jgi:hypothetical protein